MIKNLIAIAVVSILITAAIVYQKPTQPTPVAVPAPAAVGQAPQKADLVGESFAIMPADHVRAGVTNQPYNSNPPTSGPHGNALPWGFNAAEVADINVVHNLEHGGIWISYKDISADQVDLLKTIAAANSGSVIVSARAANDSPVAVVSWGQLLQLDAVDEAQINEFITQNKNKSPELLAR